MGYYINTINGKTLPPKGKADFLLENGATKVEYPVSFQENLVCVVENVFFDAAAFAFSERELMEFNNPSDHRQKKWLIVPDADILSDYKK